MPAHYVRKAEEIRDYVKLFEFGRIIWLGPGSEKIWGYDKNGEIWDPWANAFMDIVAESGILIFKGTHALAGRTLRDSVGHLENNENNKLMLIRFIHTALDLNAFISMKRNIPVESAAPEGKVATDSTDSEVSDDVEDKGDKKNPDPLKVTSIDPPISTGLAPPVPAYPGADSSIVAGDGSTAMDITEGNAAPSDGGIEKVSGPPTSEQAAAASDLAAAAAEIAAETEEDKDHIIEDQTIAPSDGGKETDASKSAAQGSDPSPELLKKLQSKETRSQVRSSKPSG